MNESIQAARTVEEYLKLERSEDGDIGTVSHFIFVDRRNQKSTFWHSMADAVKLVADELGTTVDQLAFNCAPHAETLVVWESEQAKQRGHAAVYRIRVARREEQEYIF